MPVNIYMLYVDGVGESFERVVIETVKRSHEPKIVGNPLRQRLRERMVLHGQRNVMAQQVKILQAFFVVECICFAPTQRNRTDQFPRNFQRSDATEELRRNIAVGAKKSIVRRLRKQHGALHRR